MDAQGCFLQLEKQTGHGRMIFKDCKKKNKQTNKQTHKTTTKGSECISKREFYHLLDYMLD